MSNTLHSGISMFFQLVIVIYFIACTESKVQEEDIAPGSVTPSMTQVQYQAMGTVGFIHFSINTFTDREWGYGDESPSLFNPTNLDAEQWARTAAAGGLKELILTAKHHDGFCLWPSKYTEHSVKNSPYKNGNGDVVKEFVDACRKYGLNVALYLSPWDRNHKDYGRPEYIQYYRNQLRELLTSYGKIDEIWFDGANGGDGYYGGAYESRIIDRKTYYDWDSTFALVKSLQPDILIFSDAGPDIRWVGNEHGFAGETFWSTICSDSLTIGGSDQYYLNTGDADGTDWIIGQCDVSIRPGWFYHADQDKHVKSPRELVNIYYKSVGRNAVLLLNLPPDRRGLIYKTDSINLGNFKQILDQTFKTNSALNSTVQASNTRKNSEYFSGSNITDGNPDTYWAADDKVRSASLLIDLDESNSFDRILISEPIKFGQRISRFNISVLNKSGSWEMLTEGTTIGYKRLLRVKSTSSSKIKLTILESLLSPAISVFGLFMSSDEESGKESMR